MDYQIRFENEQQKGCLLLAQWDRDVQLTITGLPQTFTDIEIHWGNRLMEEFYVVEPTIRDDSVIVLIPNILLQAPENIIGYIYLDSTTTCYRIDIEIQARQKPQGVPTDPTVPFYPLGTGIFDTDSEKAINAKAVLSILKGGNSGQSLRKKSDEDLDFEWGASGEVTSVNGQTGDVTLGAADVGALPDDTDIPTKTSDLQNDSGFINNAVNDLVNYYLKSETYTQAEVQSLIGQIRTVHFEKVTQLPPIAQASENVIYLVPRTDTESQNIYDEYIKVAISGTEPTEYSYEKIGSTDVDLTGYATETWVSQQIANFLTQSQVETIVTTALTNYYTQEQADALLRNKANTSGTYPEMTVGLADNLTSYIKKIDIIPYNFRTSGGNLDIRSGREDIKAIVGGTVCWNQKIKAILNNDFSATNTLSLSTSQDSVEVTVTSLSGTLSYNSYMIMCNNPRYYVDYILTHKILALATCKALPIDNNTSRQHQIAYRTYGGRDFTNAESYITMDNQWHTIYAIKEWTFTSHMIGDIRLSMSGINLQVGDKFWWKNVQFFDLTQMFGPNIANYIYSLEQSASGAGLTFFRSLFPKEYYDYNSGILLSVKTSAHVMTGFNLLKDDIISGTYNSIYTKLEGDNKQSFINFLSKVQLLNKSLFYSVNISNTTTASSAPPVGQIRLTDESTGRVVRLKSITPNEVFTLDDVDLSRVTHVYIYGRSPAAEVVLSDVCFNLHWDGERDGEYEPYYEVSYPLKDIELSGIPRLDANNNLYYDGDTYESDGVVTRKYNKVALSSVSNFGAYGNTGHVFRITLPNAKTYSHADFSRYSIISGYTQSNVYASYNPEYDLSYFVDTISFYIRNDNWMWFKDLSSYDSAPTFRYVSGRSDNFYKKCSVAAYADIATLLAEIGSTVRYQPAIIEVLSDETQSNAKTYYRFYRTGGTDYLTADTSVKSPSYLLLSSEPADWSTNWSQYYEQDGAALTAIRASLPDAIYILATPATETTDTYINPQYVNDWGTEEYVDTRDVLMPVGHSTAYDVNLKAKLEMYPDIPNLDGRYVLQIQGGISKYIAI